MGYLHIDNLYRASEILECYALEKIHGTSAHIAYKDGQIRFFSGGESHANFVSLFDEAALTAKFAEKFTEQNNVVIYGEAFGGKQQNMSATYGPKLRFMAFDVKIDGQWLDVPSAAGFVGEFGLEFVPYERGPLSLPWLDEQRDRPSRVAVVPDKIAEGVVIRPIHELSYNGYNHDGRFIFKHKRPEFRETKTPREVNPDKALVLSEASAIAEEWVTPMRFTHVLDKCPLSGMQDIGSFINAMTKDVQRESAGEFEWTKEVQSAVAKLAATMAKNHLLVN